MKKYAKEGEKIPFYYGYAYFDFVRGESALYPYPFNWFVRLVVFFHRKIVRFDGYQLTKDRKLYNEGLVRGFLLGKKEGQLLSSEEKYLLIKKTFEILREFKEKKQHPEVIKNFVYKETGIRIKVDV